MRTIVAGIALLGVAVTPAAWTTVRPGASQQQPTFRGSTDIVLIDAHVVARDGAPIQGLKADQFEVLVDGRRRPIVSIEFTQAASRPPAANDQPASAGSAAARDGRVVVVAVDEGSFPATTQAAAREAATRVVDRVAPQDYVGLIAFPGRIEIAPTRDRAPLRQAISRISGLRVDPPSPRFNLSAIEAMLLKGRDPNATREITSRECQSDPRNPVCAQEVIGEGNAIADMLEYQAVQSIAGLHGVLDAMASLPDRKILLVISAGLPLSNRPSARPNLNAEAERVARHAATANVNLYVFYMNVHFLRYFSAAYGKKNYAIFEDITMFGTGLEKFADSGGGTFFQIDVGADASVDRVMRETSASYLLAVQAEPDQRDGKEHFIRVTVNQRGASVRYRQIVTIPKPADKTQAANNRQ